MNCRAIIAAMSMILFLAGVSCGQTQSAGNADTAVIKTQTESEKEKEEMDTGRKKMEKEMLKIEVGDSVLWAEFAETEAAKELEEKLKEGAVSVKMSDYGGWEKVGTLPWSLPRKDVQTTAVSGDIMLYNGNSIVLFYGKNDWAYTRLGTIVNADSDTILAAFSGNAEEIRLTVSKQK